MVSFRITQLVKRDLSHLRNALFILLINGASLWALATPELQLAMNHRQKDTISALKENLVDFSPELANSKPELLAMITPDSPSRQNHVILKGPDSQARPTAVNFQRAFEQSIIKMLNQGKIRQATAIIHTDRPTTPLCHPSGEIQLDTLPDKIRNDPQRLKTVRDRTETVRLLARNQHIELFVTYTRDGLQKRSEKEKTTFKNELSNRMNRVAPRCQKK